MKEEKTGKIWKIGESACGVDKFGQSLRAKRQAKKLRRETGRRFKTKVLEYHKGKTAAKVRETELIKYLRSTGHELPGNKGVH